MVDASTAAKRRRLALVGLKLLVVAAILWGVHRTVGTASEQLSERHWSPAQLNFGWLAAAMGLYILGLLPAGWYWHRVLAALGQRTSLRAALRAYLIGHLGKYVPGKALVVILRTGLIRGSQVSTTAAAVSVFYETLTMMAVGAALAGVILIVQFRDHPQMMLIALLMTVLAGLPTMPPVFHRVAKLLGVGRADPQVLEQLANLKYSTLALGWLSMSIGWVLLGLSVWCVLAADGRATTATLGSDLPLCVAATSLAVVAGFASLIPGGAVVREFVLLELLQARFGATGAVVAAVVARLAWLVAEVLVAGLLWFASSRPSSD